MVWWESVPRGFSACAWKLLSRLFSRYNWPPLGLRGWVNSGALACASEVRWVRICSNHETLHWPPAIRPHHRHTNVYSHTFWLLWEPRESRRKWLHIKAVINWQLSKTRYPLTSITWPHRVLRCRPIQVEYFLKLSGDKLLVFKWSQAQVFFFF